MMMSSSKSSSEISSSSLLQDKTILVTGANRGIGRALVKCFVEHGAKKVYAAVRNLDSIKNDKTFGINDTQSDDSNNRRIIPLYLDLTKRDSILEASKIATDVNVIINNGGVLTNTSVMSSNCIDNLQYEMNVNVYGLIHMTQIFLPILQKRNSTTTTKSSNNSSSSYSYFVQINSVASMRCGIPDVATYSASKSAAYSLTQAIRQECQNVENSTNYSNVKVISVHPGPIATDMIINASKELAKQAEDPYNVALDVLKAITSKETPFLVFPDPKSKTMGELYLHGTSTSSKASNNNTDGNKKRKKPDDDGNGDEDEDESDDGSGDGSNSGGSGGGFGQTVIIEGKMYG